MVGLAVARALALAGREVLVLEAAWRDRDGDLLAQFRGDPRRHLLSGRHPERRACASRDAGRLYAYCCGARHRGAGDPPASPVALSRDEQVPKLAALKETGEARNGVDDLLAGSTAEEARELEPEAVCAALVPCSRPPRGSSTAMPTCCRSRANPRGAAGGVIAFNAPVIRARCRFVGCQRARGRRRGPFLALRGAGSSSTRPACGRPSLARALRGHARPEVVPPGFFAKGNYFALSGFVPLPSRHLVYPMPETGRTWHPRDPRPLRPGAVRAGRGVGRRGRVLRCRPVRGRSAYSMRRSGAIGRGSRTAALVPTYCGIRPKTVGPGESRPRTSRSRARPGTALRGSGSCSGSNCPALLPRSPSRTTCAISQTGSDSQRYRKKAAEFCRLTGKLQMCRSRSKLSRFDRHTHLEDRIGVDICLHATISSALM